MNALKDLSNLHEETMSIINLELALEALESENYQFGIESLKASAKHGTNPAALYNLGICYEQGIGVEQDRAKVNYFDGIFKNQFFIQACDYYRQASSLGHINAGFNLTRISNHIDINEEEDETIEQTSNENQSPPLREVFFRFSLSNNYSEDQSFNDYQFDLKNQTIACLS